MSTALPILVVDDDRYLLLALRQTLELAGFVVQTFERSPAALAAVLGQKEHFAAVLADIRMPELDGMALLARLHKERPELPVILITGHGDVALAVQAVKEGAYDFLQKPVDGEALLGALGRAVERNRLVKENRQLQATLEASRAERTAFYGLVGAHPAMRQVYRLIETMATAPDPVLISGETGSGKELAARALHALSAAGQPFVAVNMAALPAEMIESELFGYERGAFTGADSRKAGKFEFAGRGTLFLDEICSMPLHLQGKLLRVLEERAFCRLGGNAAIPLGARIISASNRDLEGEVASGRFRQDLYFRLNVLPLKIPSLAERVADIPLLARHFAEEYALLHGDPQVRLEPAFLDALSQRSWPGNVRELRNLVRRHCILGGQAQQDKAIGAPAAALPASDPLSTWKEHMEREEKRYLIEALAHVGGQVSAACRILGLSRKSVYEKVRRLGIDLEGLRQNRAGKNVT